MMFPLRGLATMASRRWGRAAFSTGPAADILLCSDSESGVRTLTLNDPKKRNPLSSAMIGRLTEALDVPETVGCVIIRAEGPAFSAGHNLREFSSSEPPARHSEVLGACARLMLTLVRCPVPVIASVHSVAAAAGCQLVASCDMAVAATSAVFSLPGIHLGLFCTTPGVAVARSVSSRKALAEMLFTGDKISAAEALRLGLVNAVVADEELESSTAALAARVTRHSRAVVRLGKAALRAQLAHGEDVEAAYRTASSAMAENLRQVDAQRGIQAFLKKEKPSWTHRDETID